MQTRKLLRRMLQRRRLQKRWFLRPKLQKKEATQGEPVAQSEANQGKEDPQASGQSLQTPTIQPIGHDFNALEKEVEADLKVPNVEEPQEAYHVEGRAGQFIDNCGEVHAPSPTSAMHSFGRVAKGHGGSDTEASTPTQQAMVKPAF